MKKKLLCFMIVSVLTPLTNAVNSDQASGIERNAPLPSPHNCLSGYHWTTAGTGIAHCEVDFLAPPVTTTTTTSNVSAATALNSSSSSPQQSRSSTVQAVTNAPNQQTVSSAPSITLPPPPGALPPPPETLVWAAGALKAGTPATNYPSVGIWGSTSAQAALNTGAAYSNEQFNYVYQNFGGGDKVPYPVQTLSQYNQTMRAYGCSPSAIDPSGWFCR